MRLVIEILGRGAAKRTLRHGAVLGLGVGQVHGADARLVKLQKHGLGEDRRGDVRWMGPTSGSFEMHIQRRCLPWRLFTLLSARFLASLILKERRPV